MSFLYRSNRMGKGRPTFSPPEEESTNCGLLLTTADLSNTLTASTTDSMRGRNGRNNDIADSSDQSERHFDDSELDERV